MRLDSCNFARSLGIFALVATMIGCGGGSDASQMAIKGKITMDGEPLSQAAIRFLPSATGNGGSGISKGDGTFTILGPQGQSGIAAGAYKVTVSHRLNPDGTSPPADEDMMTSKAVEKLPMIYTDPNRTTLTANVDKSGIVELKLTKSKTR